MRTYRSACLDCGYRRIAKSKVLICPNCLGFEIDTVEILPSDRNAGIKRLK